MRIQFSVRDRLIATMLIGGGVGMLVAAWHNPFRFGDPTEEPKASFIAFQGQQCWEPASANPSNILGSVPPLLAYQCASSCASFVVDEVVGCEFAVRSAFRRDEHAMEKGKRKGKGNGVSQTLCASRSALSYARSS